MPDRLGRAQNRASCCHSHVIAMAKKLSDVADVKAKRSAAARAAQALKDATDAANVVARRAAAAARQRKYMANKAKAAATPKAPKAPKAKAVKKDKKAKKSTTSSAARMRKLRALAKARGERCFGRQPPASGRPLMLFVFLKELFLANVGMKKAATKHVAKYDCGRAFWSFMILHAAIIAVKDPVDHVRLLQAAAKEWAMLDDAQERAIMQKTHEALPVKPCTDINTLAGHIWLDVSGVPH